MIQVTTKHYNCITWYVDRGRLQEPKHLTANYRHGRSQPTRSVFGGGEERCGNADMSCFNSLPCPSFVPVFGRRIPSLFSFVPIFGRRTPVYIESAKTHGLHYM